MPDPASSNAIRIFYLIARREFVTRIRSRFFLVGTAVLMILLAGYIVLQAEVFNRATTTVKAAFVGDAQALATPLTVAGRAQNLKIEVHGVSSLADGQDQVRKGSLDLVVSGDPGAPDVTVNDSVDPVVEATLNALVRQVALNRALAAAGTNPASIEAQVAAASIHLDYLDPNAAQRTQRIVVGVFVAALLYVSLLVYGQFVAAGVVEEKANRIIEILLSTVRARQLLFGKVVGVGLVGLLQLVVLAVVALIAVTRTQVVSLPTVGFVAVAGGLMWFVLGFVFYALIYAAGGSMVSRQEDLAAVTTPITMLVVGTYLAFFWVVANPNSPLAAALSMVPAFAPVLMPARMATGDAQAWQVVVAAVLTVGSIVVLNAFAARIYSNSVLLVGSRVRLSQAWRGTN